MDHVGLAKDWLQKDWFPISNARKRIGFKRNWIGFKKIAESEARTRLRFGECSFEALETTYESAALSIVTAKRLLANCRVRN